MTVPVGRRAVRVCIVAPSPRLIGGQSLAAERLRRRLAADPDLEVSFVPHDPRLPGPLRHLQRIKYVRTAGTSIAYLLSLLRALPAHDVVHVFSAAYWSFLLAPAPAILIARALGKRVIANYRSGEAGDHLARWSRTAIPVLRRADAIVVPSPFLVDVFSRFGLEARSIPNFVELEKIPYRVRRHPSPHFLSNRNFAPLYNVGCVLRAFRIIQDAMPDARLTIAGDGDERASLHRLVQMLELRNVTFLGQLGHAEMLALYGDVDVYLNAPNIDNMPNSVIESFAAGVPVVSTRAGGIPYIVTHDVTGLLVGLDDHAALAAQALRLFSEDGLALRLATAARREALEKYSWEAAHAGWRQVYGVTPRTSAVHHDATG